MTLHLTKQLSRAIQGDPSKCILFVGAGLSSTGVRQGGKGIPDWNTLIQYMIEDLRDSKNCDTVLLSKLLEFHKQGKYLDVAHIFKKQTRPDQFVAFLKEHLDPPDIIQSKIHEVILKIKLRGIISTNFDMVFEIQSDRLQPLVYPLFLGDPSAIQRDKVFVKIHGCIRHTPNIYDNLILTEESYINLRSDRRYQSLMNVFLLGYRILTVGFSLRDPDFLGLIEDVKQIFGEDMPTIYALMFRPENKARIEWRKKGVEIIPYEDHNELLGFFKEMLQLSENINPTPSVTPVSKESEIHYIELLESWRSSQKIDESYAIIENQLEQLKNGEQKESFLFQLLALMRKNESILLSPFLLSIDTDASREVLLNLMANTEKDDNWNTLSPHSKLLKLHKWVSKSWPKFSKYYFAQSEFNRTFNWLLDKEWVEFGIDPWESFLSLLNQIVSVKNYEALDDLYDVCHHIEGANERIEKIVFSKDFVREDDPDHRWFKSWDESVVNHIKYEKFKSRIRNGEIEDYNLQLSEASRLGYLRYVVEQLLRQYVQHTHLTLHSSSGLYDPDKANSILESLAELKGKDKQLTVLWAINRWPEEMRGLLSLGEDTKSLRKGLFIPLWWRYASETRVEYLQSHRHGKMHEVFWGTGQDFLFVDMMGFSYDIDQDFRDTFNSTLDQHLSKDGFYKYEPRPFEEIWRDRELTYLFSKEIPPELVRRIAVKRVDWDNSQPGHVRWKEALERAAQHMDNRNLSDFVSIEEKNYVIDNLLGAYLPAKFEIILYPSMIEYTADELRIDKDALSTVVYIHETVHAYSHIGKDLDGRHWAGYFLPNSLQPDFSPSKPHEAIAQYYTFKLLETLNDEKLMKAFLTLEQHCDEVYRVWRNTEKYTLEEMRDILVEYRNTGSEWPPSF